MRVNAGAWVAWREPAERCSPRVVAGVGFCADRVYADAVAMCASHRGLRYCLHALPVSFLLSDRMGTRTRHGGPSTQPTVARPLAMTFSPVGDLATLDHLPIR
jgi:hypothetical protein